MKLSQLRYVTAVRRHGLNVTAAAESLFVSQPAVSRQILLLEDELGVPIFERCGKSLIRITPIGETILAMAEDALDRLERIGRVAEEARDPERGELSVATTHTQARYALPPVVSRFRQRFPEVALHLHQGSPMQIATLASRGDADFAIATEALEHFENLVMMPCYEWNRAVVVPAGHELAARDPLTLADIAAFPIVTYVFGFTGRSRLDEAFGADGLDPRVVFTATDADVIKTYVRLGLGVGIVARMAYDPVIDGDLVARDIGHLVGPSQTRIGFRRGLFLRGFMYDFIEVFAPHLTRDVVDACLDAPDAQSREALFRGIDLPCH